MAFLKVSMTERRCLARITNWEKTNFLIAPRTRVSCVSICRNTPEEGLDLCKKCLSRNVGGKNQTPMIHGLLYEPIPDYSRVYGSPWYYDKVREHGEPDPSILKDAIAAMKAAEEWALEAKGAIRSKGSAQTQSAAINKEEMPVKKITKQRVVKEKQKVPVVQKMPLLIKVIYEESSKPPQRLPTDSYTAELKDISGTKVWIVAGRVFDSTASGEIGELIGKYVDGQFVDL